MEGRNQTKNAIASMQRIQQRTIEGHSVYTE